MGEIKYEVERGSQIRNKMKEAKKQPVNVHWVDNREGCQRQGSTKWQGHKAGPRKQCLRRKRSTGNTSEVSIRRLMEWWFWVGCGTDVLLRKTQERNF